jgi:ribosomal protein S17
VTNRQEHKRVLNLSVISQSEHQTYIVIIEENIEVRQYTRQDTLRSSDV